MNDIINMATTVSLNEPKRDDRLMAGHARQASSTLRGAGLSSVTTATPVATNGSSSAIPASAPFLPQRNDSAATSSSRSDSQGFLHCSFCLAAEFDIDKGSTLAYQYPAPSGHDEHMLAELMLPDGVHARSEDWTVFFLPKEEQRGPARDDSVVDTSVGSSRGESASASHDEAIHLVNSKGKGRREKLYYALSLVRTKHDTSVRRGALVKAIAIVSCHPFIQIFKPALLLALDEYFQAPSVDVLMRLFDALNSLNLSMMPSFNYNEKLLLRCTDRRDLFEERFSAASRSMTNLRPLPGAGGNNGTSSPAPPIGKGQGDDGEKIRDTNDSALVSVSQHIRSRTASDSSSYEDSTIKQVQQATLQAVPGRRTLGNRPSLASLRKVSSSGGIMKRKPSSTAATQELTLQQQMASSSNNNNNNNLRATSFSSANGQTVHRVKDTHVWETTVSYGKIQELPIRVPTDVFEEEVGEYSLVHLISVFGTSSLSGPQHPHLHSNGHLTNPIILLFNAAVTGKRVIFLGHNQPANQVASHVLSLCALATGCGTAWRGMIRRCFPYANLLMMDELERVPGYIAGVTNPRFEELRCWDVLCNIETGRITVSRDIEAAPPLRPTAAPSMSNTYSSSMYAAGIGPESTGAAHTMSRAPSEPDVSISSSTASQGTGASGTSNTNTTSLGSVSGGSSMRGRDRANTTSEARQDTAENAFMDEILQAIAARYGERHVRARFANYAAHFLRLAARHEEYFYGQTSIAPPSQPFLNGQLGSGAVFSDRDLELKKIHVNAHRVEGWRATESYALYCSAEAVHDRRGTMGEVDLGHQMARLRRAKRMQPGETELLFTTLAQKLRTSEQVLELLTCLPLHNGGLLPLSNGLFHPSPVVRSAATEILLRIASNSAGRKLMQSLNLFHRLAFARLLHDSQDLCGAGGGGANHESIRRTHTPSQSLVIPPH